MPVETAADRLAFFDTEEFGVEVSYTPAAGGGATTIIGHFDSAAASIEVDGEVAVQTRQPQLQCRVGDLAGGGHEGDTISITSGQLTAAGLDTAPAGTYKVRVVEPDGTGMVTLILEKQ